MTDSHENVVLNMLNESARSADSQNGRGDEASLVMQHIAGTVLETSIGINSTCKRHLRVLMQIPRAGNLHADCPGRLRRW